LDVALTLLAKTLDLFVCLSVCLVSCFIGMIDR